jgi:transposase
LIEPLLPPWPDKSPGPRPVPDRQCLQGILFVVHTGIGWEDLPQELGFGSGMTCWRRLKRWTDAGVFDQLHNSGAVAGHDAVSTCCLRTRDTTTDIRLAAPVTPPGRAVGRTSRHP